MKWNTKVCEISGLTCCESRTKVPNKILDAGEDGFEGGLSTKKYISIAKTSTATAKRDIADLVSKRLIAQVGGAAGRNVRYVVKFSS